MLVKARKQERRHYNIMARDGPTHDFIIYQLHFTTFISNFALIFVSTFGINPANAATSSV